MEAEGEVSSPTPSTRWRTLVTGLTLLLLASVAAALGLQEFWKAEVRADLASLRQTDLGIDDYEALIARPEVPVEDNAATLMLKAAREFDYESLPQRKADLLGSLPLFLDASLADPTQAEELLLVDYSANPNALESDVAGIVSRVDRAQPLLRASLEKPSCQFEVQPLEGPRTPGSLFEIRRLLSGLQLAATTDFRGGRYDAGWGRIQLGIEVCTKIQEPTLFDYLGLSAFLGSLSHALGELCSLGPPPSPSRCRKISAALRRLEVTHASRALQGLRVDFAGALLLIDEGQSDYAPASNWLSKTLLREKWRRDLTHTASRFLEFGAAGWASSNLPRGSESPFAQIFSATLPALRKKVLNNLALYRMTLFTLDLLTGNSLPQPPLDPWSPDGRPLNFKRSNRELRVWSVGSDGIDHEGKGGGGGGSADRIWRLGIHEPLENEDFVVVVEPPR